MLKRIGTTGLLIAVLSGSGAYAANASECSGSGADAINITNVATTYLPGDYRQYGDAGTTITLESGRSSTASADIEVSGTVTADAVVASASATIGRNVGTSETVSLGSSASAVVPAGLTGQYMELGAAARSFDWSKTDYNSGCAVISSFSGSGVAPTTDPYARASWS